MINFSEEAASRSMPNSTDAKGGVRVSRFESRHLGEVCDIEDSSFSHPFSKNYFNKLSRFYPETFLIAENKEQVIGYIVAEIDQKRAHILSIAVREIWRRKQVGLTLMKELLKILQLKEIKEIHLEVRSTNIAARSLYENLGFKMTGYVRGYYGSEDAASYYLML